MEGYRRVMIELIQLKSPQAMADCETCKGKGATTSGRPCGLCHGTGVMVVT